MADSSLQATLQYDPPARKMSELTDRLQAANNGPFVNHLIYRQGFKIGGFSFDISDPGEDLTILDPGEVLSREDLCLFLSLSYPQKMTLYIDVVKRTSLLLAWQIACQTIEPPNDYPSTPNKPLSVGQWQVLVALHRALLYQHYEGYLRLQRPLSQREVLSPGASLLKSNTFGSSGAFAPSHRPRPSRLIREPSVPARLEGKTVSAFPDTGAAANFLNIDYARQHGFEAGDDTGESVKVGNGSLVKVLGTMTLPFSFAEESKVHQVDFKVLASCIHDVVLGSPFLKLTQTLSRFKERIQQKVRKVLTHSRVCSLGSHQYVDGQLNGFNVSAVPDTGADVSVMSASFAKRHGFHVDTSEHNQIVLEFADGSTATTTGVVKNMEWKYDSSFPNHGERLDMYVLEGLAEEVILSYDFLNSTDAFVTHEEDFWTNEGEDDLSIDWIFNIIKLVSKVLKQSMESAIDSTKSPTNTNSPKSNTAITWHQQKAEELQLYRKAKLEAQQLPEDQREAFLKPHLARWHRFLASRPAESNTSTAEGSSSSSSSLSSSSTSPASSQGVMNVSAPPPSPSPPSNAPASPAKASLPKGRSKYFSKALKARWRLNEDAANGSSSLV